MAQIKKYQNSGVINTPKIKVNMDGVLTEFTEEEYDQILANAYKQIRATGSIGSGDDHVWAQRMAKQKEQAKQGTYTYDTTPEQVLSLNYDGSASNEDLGLSKKGKVKKVTQFGKAIGGVDEDSRQMSIINEYFGRSARDLIKKKQEDQKALEATTLTENQAKAKAWAENFSKNFGLGKSSFGSEYTSETASTLLKPYWAMPDDVTRVNWLSDHVYKALLPLYELDPKNPDHALKIEALKQAQFDVEKMQKTFENYFVKDQGKANLGDLSKLWEYANAQDSTQEDIYFWDKDAYTKAGQTNLSEGELTQKLIDDWNKGKATGTGTGTDPNLTDTKPVIPSKDDWSVGDQTVENPFKDEPYEIPNELYKLRSIKFKVANQPVSPVVFRQYLQSLPDSNEKITLSSFMDKYDAAYEQAYGYRTNNWYDLKVDEQAIATNSPVRKLFPDFAISEKYLIDYLGENNEIVVFQTIGKDQYDYEGKPLPRNNVYIKQTGQTIPIKEENISWNPKSKKYEIRVGDKVHVLPTLAKQSQAFITKLIQDLGINTQKTENSSKKTTFGDHVSGFFTGKNQDGTPYLQEGGQIRSYQNGQPIVLNSEEDNNKFLLKLSEVYNLPLEKATIKMKTMVDSGLVKPYTETTVDAAAGFTPREFRIEPGNMPGEYNENEIKEWKSQEIVNAFDWDSLSKADVADLGSLVGDIMSFSGGVPGAVAGAGSAIQSTYANIVRDGFQGSDLAWGTLDLGLAALSAVPMVGGLAKVPRIAQKVLKLKKPLKALQIGLVGLGFANQATVVDKMLAGDFDKINIQDMRNLVSGLAAMRQTRSLTKNLGSLTKGRVAPGEGVVRAKFNTKTGVVEHPVRLTKKELDYIKQAPDQHVAAKEVLAKRVQTDAELSARLNGEDITQSNIEVPLGSEYNVFKPWKNTSKIGINDQVKTSSTFLATKPLPDPRTGIVGRLTDFAVGNRVSQSAKTINDPNIRKIALPLSDAANRPRLRLKDGKMVEVKGHEELKAFNRTDLKAKLKNSEEGVKILKEFNKVDDIDAALTKETRKTVVPNSKASTKKQEELLKKLETIDKKMGQAQVIAKDKAMIKDVATARKRVQEIIAKHKSALQATKLSTKQLPSAERKQLTKGLGTKSAPSTPTIETPKLPPIKEILSGPGSRFKQLPETKLYSEYPRKVTKPSGTESKIKKATPVTKKAKTTVTKETKAKPKKLRDFISDKQLSIDFEGQSKPKVKTPEMKSSEAKLRKNKSAKTLDKSKTNSKAKGKLPKKQLPRRADGGILIPMFQQEGVIFPQPIYNFKKRPAQYYYKDGVQYSKDGLNYTQFLKSYLNDQYDNSISPKSVDDAIDISPSLKALGIPMPTKGLKYPYEKTENKKLGIPSQVKGVTLDPSKNTYIDENGNIKLKTVTPTSIDATPTNPLDSNAGFQPGTTKDLPKFEINKPWLLKTASTIAKIRNLNNQDTRYTPQLQTQADLPISTVSGSLLLEDQYAKQAANAQQQQSIPQTADAKLNTQARMSTEQNLRNFLAEGNLKVQGMRDALGQKQTEQTAANIQGRSQAANANQVELAKMQNQERTNKNFISRNKVDIATGLMDNRADYLMSEEDRKKNLKQTLAISNINRHFDDLFSTDYQRLSALEQMSYTNPSAYDEAARKEHAALTRKLARARNIATDLSYKYQLDGTEPDLTQYTRDYFEQQ